MSFMGPTLADLGTTSDVVNQQILADAAAGAPNSIPSSDSAFGIDNPTAVLWADPTNTGDSGVIPDTSVPAGPSVNNPETAGGGSLWNTLSKAIDGAFAGYQLAQQPASARRSVTTSFGGTQVSSSGFRSPLSSLSPAQQSQFIYILLFAAVIIVILMVARRPAGG